MNRRQSPIAGMSAQLSLFPSTDPVVGLRAWLPMRCQCGWEIADLGEGRSPHRAFSDVQLVRSPPRVGKSRKLPVHRNADRQFRPAYRTNSN